MSVLAGLLDRAVADMERAALLLGGLEEIPADVDDGLAFAAGEIGRMCALIAARA